MNAIQKIGSAHLARQEDQLTEEQVELIKRTIARGATNDELSLFVSVCNRMRLDPFARQIYFVKRRVKEGDRWIEKGEAQVSIDGFRLVAERTGQYRGQTTPMWCGKDGKWVDVWLSSEPPAAAKVGVYREGFREPLVRVAKFDSYAQRGKDGLLRMWKTMPEVMILKCAEALALRAAFPNELSGVYTIDEMGQADNESHARPGKPARTLDDVAGDGMHQYAVARVEDGDADTHDEREDWEKLFDGGPKDQWGITMPTCPPPRFSERANPQFRGKLWSDPSISGAVFAKFLEEGADEMTSPQRAWAVYRATERQARKAHEAKQAEGKSNG